MDIAFLNFINEIILFKISPKQMFKKIEKMSLNIKNKNSKEDFGAFQIGF
jgi:hypothetical protein